MRVRPLADTRILAPIALVAAVVAFVLLNAGATTVEVRVEPRRDTDGGAVAPVIPEREKTPVIAEFEAPFRRKAISPVADVDVSMGELIGRSKERTAIYAWPTRVEQTVRLLYAEGGKRQRFSVIATDEAAGANSKIGAHLPGAVFVDDPVLVDGQRRVADELRVWLAGPRTQPFVARYGEPLRTLPQALVAIAVGALLLWIFARPSIEMWTTGHPGSFELRARRYFGARTFVFTEAEAEQIGVRSRPRAFGLLSNRLVFRRGGEGEAPLMPFGTFALQRAVTLRQDLVDAVRTTAPA